jgi:DNA polymerase III alpha subunit (gram-positive type)
MICSIATKTTGLKQGSHEVIELSIKPFALGAVTYRMKPERLDIYDAKAQEMNGISAVVAGGFLEKEQVKEMILSQFKDITAIGHNIRFDFDMIVNTLGSKFAVEFFGKNRMIDTMVLAETDNLNRCMRSEPPLFKNLRLDNICKVLEIDTKVKVERIEEVYRRLGGGN